MSSMVETKPVLSPQELLSLQGQQNLVLVDARAGNTAKQAYHTLHLSGARYVDPDADLAAATNNPAVGGRHPLPDIHQFAQVLQRLGIAPESHVVVYDDKSGANAAARFWWMLKAVGHAQVQMLDGGLDAARAIGFPTDATVETDGAAQPYPVTEWQLPLAGIAEVEKAAADPNYLVIDVRDAARYNGEHEPIDLVAGHIPGAVNIPFSTNLNADGSFRAPEQLRQQYTQALGSRNADTVIVHCGSGITACHTLVALAQAGLAIPKLYIGSWSEWSRTDRPVATARKS